MATYYNCSNDQRDGTPMIYLPGSYPDAPILPGSMMMYMNSGSYSDALAGNTQQQNTCIEILSVEAPNSTQQQQQQQVVLSNLGGPRNVEHDFNAWRDGRSQMLTIQSVGSPSSILNSGQNLQGQGLSLSLGTQIPSAIHMPSISYRNPSSGFASFLSPNPSMMGEGSCRNGSSRDEQSRSIEYLQPGFVASNQDYVMTSLARTIPNSKFLKAAQQLLDEVVNVGKALKHPDKEKNQSTHEQGMNNLKESDNGLKNEPSNPQDSSNDSQSELSHAERQDLQNKLSKLLSMLNEMDRRYKQYYHQMQIVVSSFDVVAGNGAAKPYTELALHTISRHFRCLRDAIAGQIRATRKSLGEQESSDNGKGFGIPRLRFVDQQLRQQRAFQQLGMMQQHAWRPQRGLPESSVSILRAWLFEHFLHPYPKDSDKIMLARKTGLTRSQVSNWFINARVRLWKPMVEEMYKEETGDGEMDSISSSENAAKAVRGDTSEDRGDEMQQSASSTAPERCSFVQLIESGSDHIHDVEMAGSNARSNVHSGTRGDAIPDYGLLKLSEQQKPCMDECNLFPDALVHSDGGDRFIAAAAAAYQISEAGRFGAGNGVSLTLGLQHCEGGSLPISGSSQHSFISIRGDNVYGTAASSAGAEPSEYEYVNPENRQQQHRFGSSHLFHDFVA